MSDKPPGMPAATTDPDDADSLRRALVMAPLLAAFATAFPDTAKAAKIDRSETQITLPDQMRWQPWNNLPAHIGEMSTLFGSLKAAGPYLVLMKWYPGYMSAPHSYRTDRLSFVVSGTWWVNSGADFDPASTIPVPAGSFVRRVARTPHYDGVKQGHPEPAVIALFGIGPVDMRLADPSRTPYRKL